MSLIHYTVWTKQKLNPMSDCHAVWKQQRSDNFENHAVWTHHKCHLSVVYFLKHTLMQGQPALFYICLLNPKASHCRKSFFWIFFLFFFKSSWSSPFLTFQPTDTSPLSARHFAYKKQLFNSLWRDDVQKHSELLFSIPTFLYLKALSVADEMGNLTKAWTDLN